MVIGNCFARHGDRSGRLRLTRSRTWVVLAVALLAVVALDDGASAATAAGPTVLATFGGPVDPSTGPPDSTLAAGPDRLVEMVNSQYSIVDRSGAGVSGPLRDLVGSTTADFISDPQVAWDPGSRRFYFSIFENHGGGANGPDEGIAWGFSRTASPNGTADWCQYFTRFDYGSTAFPDRPSLGFNADHVLFVSERFSVPEESFQGVDLAWVHKPAGGRKCPKASMLRTGVTSLRDTTGQPIFYGTAVRQVDPNATGWVLGQSQDATTLMLYRVASGAHGSATVGSATAVAVPSYSFPPPAPQAGTDSTGSPARPLETKGYLTQAYSALDPRLGHVDIWTAHGVAGGAGAAVRWYEISPSDAALDQVGTIEDPALYVFNGTIAPDRKVNGNATAYGSNMVMTVNTSSAGTDSDIRLVSKQGADPQSPMVLLLSSPGPNVDSNCFQPSRSGCRWGDYSGAAPDPGAPSGGTAGQVWTINQWNVASLDDQDVDWRTKTVLAAP
jgi:hypothetical protein